MLLCDYAQVAEGKLYVIGGGWSVTGPQPAPSAVALKIDVPWDRANQRMHLELSLLGEDGQPVTMPGPAGPQPVRMDGQFEVGRPPGLKPGTPIDVALAMNVGPLPLPPGQRYSWELSIDGETAEEWHLAFQTRDVPRDRSDPASLP